MKPEPKKKITNKKVISSAKFEAKEQFTKSALENLKTENERLVNSLKKSYKLFFLCQVLFFTVFWLIIFIYKNKLIFIFWEP